MEKFYDDLKKTFQSDIIYKPIKITNRYLHLYYLESLCSSDKINLYILRNITKIKNLNKIEEYLSTPNVKKIKESEILFYLENGFALINHKKSWWAAEVRAEINRGISAPDSEPSINGPKDAFSENYQINIGLIKRRIKSQNLTIKNKIIGKKTKTNIGILFLNDIVDYKTLDILEKRIDKIDIDGILDSSTLALILEKDDNTTFPTIIKSERPDTISQALLEGKIAIVVDTSPFVLVLPAFFADFINPQSDNYSKSNNINFVKVLRLACFFISIMLPAFYIAVINYNQEAIPTSLLINFSAQRSGVPFPGVVEAVVMLIICEILRESDLRFPNAYGSAISILGALILGEAAVSAGIVSPIMIIVTAISFITSLIFTEYELINALRHYRFVFLLLASTYGIIGLISGVIYFLIRINSINSFEKSYFFPIAPFSKIYFNKTIFKNKVSKDIYRSSLIAKNNLIKYKEHDWWKKYYSYL